MAASLLLDRTTWDLTVDAAGNIAVATDPYSLAQDAASAIKVFLGEWYWNTTVGVPYLTQIFGVRTSVGLLTQVLRAAALRVEGVVTATVVLSTFSNRTVAGQVQVTSATGEPATATFAVINPQGS